MDEKQSIYIKKENIEQVKIQDLIYSVRKFGRKTENQYVTLQLIRKKYFVMCLKCGEYRAMQIHHLDKNRKNNLLNNLILLCKACHRKIHNINAKNFNFNGGGSRTHSKGRRKD